MTTYLQATLILLLFVVLPGSAWAEKYKRGHWVCSNLSEEYYRQDPDDLYTRSLYASCLVIKGEDNQGLPKLYTLADQHDHIPSSFFLANYLVSDGKLSAYLTQTNIEEALKYFFRTLALIDLSPNYPGEDLDLYELDVQAELKSTFFIPMLYFQKYLVGIMNDSCKRAIPHGYKKECPTHQGYDTTTMDSLKKVIQYARECASLPKKRFFTEDYYQANMKACPNLEELASKLIPMEEKRQQLLERPDCQDPINCEDYMDNYGNIKRMKKEVNEVRKRHFYSSFPGQQ